MKQFRNFVATIFDISYDAMVERLDDEKADVFQYIVFQEEKCPTTDKLHLQLYAEPIKRMTLNKIKKWFGSNTMHIEPRFGTQKEAIAYCKKKESRTRDNYEFGKPKQAGKRMDLNIMRDRMMAGERLSDMIKDSEQLNYQCLKGAQLMQPYLQSERNEKPTVIWIWGSTETNKTRCVFDNFDDIYKSPGYKWWNNYEQQEVCLVDDYRPCYCKFVDLLTFLDRYPLLFEYKGGYVQFNSPLIIFTSPKSPMAYWENRTDEDLLQLRRRITLILHADDMNLLEVMKELKENDFKLDI